MALTVQSHIVLDENGVAKVKGTGYKVRLLAEEHRRGDSAERIQRNHADLTLGQVYSVLSYYYDHKEEMDVDMDRRYEYAERMRKEAGGSPTAKRLRDLDYLPHQHIPTDEEIFAEIEASKHS